MFPSKKSGLDFLKENNAWGFVSINRQPEYAAFYLTSGVSEVQYVARVARVVQANDANLARPPENYLGEQAEFDPDQKVVVFEPGTLRELATPIPFETKYPQGLRYTDLHSLRTASTTDDLL